MSGGDARPAVSVVVPFYGSREAAIHMDAALAKLDPHSDDELIVADNTEGGTVGLLPQSGARVVSAPAQRSPYHARNAGARAAGNPWILFMDSDCAPADGLLDAYFALAAERDVGAMAGSIEGVGAQRTLVARYVRSRRFFDQSQGLHTHGGGAATANLLVRLSAFEAVGGFVEGIRSAGDVDLTWRLQAAGWKLVRRPEAVVYHRHRERLVSLMRAVARYGAGSSWLNRRYPGASPRWRLPRALAGAAADCLAMSLRGDREEACFRALDGLGLIAHNVGYLASNAVPERHRV
jgi:GT2 family glycosyltransferase